MKCETPLCRKRALWMGDTRFRFCTDCLRERAEKVLRQNEYIRLKNKKLR